MSGGGLWSETHQGGKNVGPSLKNNLKHDFRSCRHDSSGRALVYQVQDPEFNNKITLFLMGVDIKVDKKKWGCL
jgi:hypothetical protein